MHNSESPILDMGDHIQLSLAECHSLFVQRSAPIFAVDQRDRPDLFATCVPVMVNGRAFLLTAVHAIYEIERTGSAVHVGGKNILVVPGEFIRTSPEGKDPLDIAAVEIPLAYALENGISILAEQQTTAGRTFSRPHMYCMHGYPLTKNKPFKSVEVERKVVNTYAFTYAGTLIDTPDFRHEARSGESHMALSYGLGRNEEGIKVNPPKPKGMSGGGLWVVPNSFNPLNVFLGGILIEHHGNTVLATKIEPALSFVANNF